MEIVLTAEEIDAATHSEDEYQLAMHALCRAQVAKVDTDLLAPLEKQLQAQLTTVLRTIEEGDETECIRGAAAAYSARPREVHEIRAALKAAGGEGK